MTITDPSYATAGPPHPDAAAQAQAEAEKLPTVGQWGADPTPPRTPADLSAERAILRWAADRLEAEWSEHLTQDPYLSGSNPPRPAIEQLRVWAAELDNAPATVPLADHPALQWLAVRLWQCAQDGDGSMELHSQLADWLADRQATGLDAVPEAGTAPATVYQLPAEPPPEVTELWDRSGDRWERKRWPFQPDGSPAEPGTVSWMWERNGLGERWRWPGLLGYGPLSTTPPAGTEAEATDGCDTCSGTGWIERVPVEGVPGSGCIHGCPDCEVGRARLAAGELREDGPDE